MKLPHINTTAIFGKSGVNIFRILVAGLCAIALYTLYLDWSTISGIDAQDQSNKPANSLSIDFTNYDKVVERIKTAPKQPTPEPLPEPSQIPDQVTTQSASTPPAQVLPEQPKP